MFSEEFGHEVHQYLTTQASNLLSTQMAVNARAYTPRTGELTRALSDGLSSAGNMVGGTASDGSFEVTVRYPRHIRFLDMKKTAKGVKKKKYEPIYNKYVYGYLRSDIRKKLRRVVPVYMIKEFNKIMTSVK